VDRRNRSVIGKFLLQSAFFRFALLPQHRLRYIGRADDDAIVNVSTIIDELMAHRLLRTTRYLVYGPLRNWFMWMPAEMVEVCWSTSPKLFEKLHKRMVEANGSRRYQTHPCLRDQAVGPFPFAAGPLIVISHDLIGLLAPRIAADEHYLLEERPHATFVLPHNGSLRRVRPGSPTHPAMHRHLLFEDVYLFAALFMHPATRRLPIQLVSVPISEWRTDAQRPSVYLSQARYRSTVYHNLKTPDRMAWFANGGGRASGMLQPRSTAPVCDAPGSPRRSLGEKMLAVHDCCAGWQMCYMVDQGSRYEGGSYEAPSPSWDFAPENRLKWVDAPPHVGRSQG